MTPLAVPARTFADLLAVVQFSDPCNQVTCCNTGYNCHLHEDSDASQILVQLTGVDCILCLYCSRHLQNI